MSKPSPDAARRRLLARTGRTAVAGAAVAVLSPAAPALPVTAQVAQSTPAPDRQRGYRESEHTRRYYQLARF
jgi:hypothetical protein